MSIVENPVEVQSELEFDSDDELENVPCTEGIDGPDLEAFRCIGCKTLPFTALFQCQNGHQICAGCYMMRVLDKMLGEQLGTCPQCGVRIYRHEPYRNTNGELTLANAFVCCELCLMVVQRDHLRHHKTVTCLKRVVVCKCKRIGCPWKGHYGSEQRQHERKCEFRNKKGFELIETLRKMQDQRDAKRCLLGKVMKLLQLPLITVRMLQILPQVDGYPCNVWVVGNKFDAFGQSWSVQYKWQSPEVDTASNEDEQALLPCSFLFKLRLESPDTCRASLGLTYSLIGCVYTDVHFLPNLCEKCDYTRDNQDGPTTLLYENSYQSMERLITERGIFSRLMMARI